jgi:hypothetical protein
MRWAVKESQEEMEWFREYVDLALRTPAPRLPATSQRIGVSSASWFLTEPGVAFIKTAGGSPDDRLLAEIVVRNQLRGHGIKQARYSFDGSSELRKEATWDDIEAKAKRLIDSRQVQLLRNGAQNVIGHVIGDHGEYQTEFSRDDPNSQAMTQWQCECPWDQYAWQRTRQWKKYEGRPCAHVLATWWASKMAPLDEDAHPGNQQSLFGMPSTPGGGQGSPFAAPAPAPQGQQMMLPGMMPGQATGTPGMPSQTMPNEPGLIPPFPMTPDPNAPVVNPASVPGLRQPSPTNPVQYPGGTFSSVQDDWEFGSMAVMAAQPQGFLNGNMVSTTQDDFGQLIGRSEEHGSGQTVRIPKGSVGEVLGQDPTTGMVNVLFENKMTEKMGPMEPNGVVAWFFASELRERPDIRRPGPAVRRR